MTTKTETREHALAAFLDISEEDIETEIEAVSHTDNAFEAEGGEYLVLTDSEADEAAEGAIRDSLWAFNAEFIASHTKCNLNSRAIEALRKMQGELCEDANPLVEAMIDDMDDFVSEAISADGRGHFLSGYDGEENEEGEYFIYRTN